MKYTLDASVLVKLVVEEEYSQNAVKIISDPRAILYAPEIIYHEVGSVLYKMTRRGITDKKYAIKAYENLIKLPIEISSNGWGALPDILEMSLRLGLHFYDCLYIYNAEKTGSTLVSSDRRLLDVAKKECSSKHLESIS